MSSYQKTYAYIQRNYRNAILSPPLEKPYKLTPFIITFCEGILSSIDIKNYIEMGLKIVRFKMYHVTKADKIVMLKMIQDAVRWCCEKYEVSTWPITISIDIPNACIRTGFIKENFDGEIELKDDWIVKLTADAKYWNKCDSRTIYIDDSYIIKDMPCGTEIAIRFGQIVMKVIEVIDEKTLKCKVFRGGTWRSMDFVCVRGVKHNKPPLNKIDLELIQFAKDFELDIITVNSLRKPETLGRIRKMFGRNKPPLIISTICEQEGLDNIDEIIKRSDGLILAREFLAYEIVNPQKMITIQLNLSAKCKQQGIPFYISGNILEHTLNTGALSSDDVNDVTNAVLQGAGFVLRSYKNAENVTQAMAHLGAICKAVEPLTPGQNDFWRLCDTRDIPVNAAEACVISCGLLARVMEATAIVIPTVTGQTAIWVSRLIPEAAILAISTSPRTARQLQIHRGVIPIVYDRPAKPNWIDEMDERIKFAVNYGIKYEILRYGVTYVAFRKAYPFSAYADTLSCNKVMSEEYKKNKMDRCPSTF